MHHPSNGVTLHYFYSAFLTLLCLVLVYQNKVLRTVMLRWQSKMIDRMGRTMPWIRSYQFLSNQISPPLFAVWAWVLAVLCLIGAVMVWPYH